MFKERKNLRKVIAVAICLVGSATMFAQETGVVINGVTWATRNVDAPSTFVANTKDAGMFYQWNSKIGWSTTDPLIATDGSTTWNSSWNGNGATTWEAANDPSPAGWHVPTKADFDKLLDATKVDFAWTTVNGVNGGLFTDKISYNSIFLPAAGYRNANTASGQYGLQGCYWSGTAFNTTRAYNLYFTNPPAMLDRDNSMGFSVRPVKDSSTGIDEVSVDTENGKVTGYFDILGGNCRRSQPKDFTLSNTTTEKQRK